MIAKQAYVIIGNDRTGKTTLQKRIAKHLCKVDVERLTRNRLYPVKHPEAPEHFKNISLMNRSYQEKLDEYKSIPEFFEKHFAPADVVILSSHLKSNDIHQMMIECGKKIYNVNLVILENSLIDESELIGKIASFPKWSKIIVLPNPVTESVTDINTQLDNAARIFINHLIENSKIN